MPSEHFQAEIRRRYQFKQVPISSLQQLYKPKHVLFATPNPQQIVEFYQALHIQSFMDPRRHLLLTAANAEEAVTRARHVPIHALVVDKYVPANGGYDLYFRLEEFLKEKMPPTLMLLPPGDTSPIERPNYGLIHLYRGLYNPMAVLKGVATILARSAAAHPAPAVSPPQATVPQPQLAAAAR